MIKANKAPENDDVKRKVRAAIVEHIRSSEFEDAVRDQVEDAIADYCSDNNFSDRVTDAVKEDSADVLSEVIDELADSLDEDEE